MWLCYTEAEVWRLTPRQLKAQLDVHKEVMQQMYGGSTNGRAASRNPAGFIDQIPGW